jgi:hypothetical protein
MGSSNSKTIENGLSSVVVAGIAIVTAAVGCLIGVAVVYASLMRRKLQRASELRWSYEHGYGAYTVYS